MLKNHSINKTQILFDAVKDSPIRQQDAISMLGSASLLDSFVKSGFLKKYIGDDPVYLTAERGNKPTCLWIKKGDIEYKKTIKAPAKGILKAIKILELHGYTVLPPNA